MTTEAMWFASASTGVVFPEAGAIHSNCRKGKEDRQARRQVQNVSHQWKTEFIAEYKCLQQLLDDNSKLYWLTSLRYIFTKK